MISAVWALIYDACYSQLLSQSQILFETFFSVSLLGVSQFVLRLRNFRFIKKFCLNSHVIQFWPLFLVLSSLEDILRRLKYGFYQLSLSKCILRYSPCVKKSSILYPRELGGTCFEVLISVSYIFTNDILKNFCRNRSLIMWISIKSTICCFIDHRLQDRRPVLHLFVSKFDMLCRDIFYYGFIVNSTKKVSQTSSCFCRIFRFY